VTIFPLAPGQIIAQMWPEGVKGMNPKILTGCIYVAKLIPQYIYARSASICNAACCRGSAYFGCP